MIDKDLIPPAELILKMMDRVYQYGMTTTSGGNMSIMDDRGDMWISPAGVDKGTLSERDIVCVKSDGQQDGIHEPSSEYPFHKAIYEKRPDVKAVLHAHPPALVSFSIIRQIPDITIIPQAKHICGSVGYAPYALPGSKELGERIADKFAEGYDVVILENHGVVTAGGTLFNAFQRFETLEFCARIAIRAASLGTPTSLSDRAFQLFEQKDNKLEEFQPNVPTTEERVLRRKICTMLRRAYDQQLVSSTEGTWSVRLDETSFIITPYGIDRKYLDPEDLVLIQNGKRESGKTPSRSVRLHEKIYADNPDIGSVLIAHPPSTLAFAVTDAELDSRSIPESYVVLRNIPKLPYGAQIEELDKVSSTLGKENPVILIQNDCVITAGKNMLEAYDRLEVCEFGATALLNAQQIGELVPIDDEEVKELDKEFLGDEQAAEK